MIKLARLAHETGLFPVFQAEGGEITGVSKIRCRVSVEDYLHLQKRFAHLFGAHGRPDLIARIQAMADKNIKRFALVKDAA